MKVGSMSVSAHAERIDQWRSGKPNPPSTPEAADGRIPGLPQHHGAGCHLWTVATGFHLRTCPRVTGKIGTEKRMNR